MATATPKLPNHLRVCGFEFEVEKADGSGWEPILDATCAFVRLHLKKTPQFFIHGTTHYEAKFRADGAMVQKNRDSGTEREVRLTPGFGFEEKGVTIKVRDPVVTEALLKVQSDGSPQRYSSRTYGKSPVRYEVRREADADGTWRIVQKNLTTLKERDLFLLPSYFAFEDDGWVPIVDASAMHAQTLFKQKSHTHNTRGVFRLQSKLDADGSLLQTDLVSNTTCRVRPVGRTPTPTFEVEIKPGQWKLMTNAAINEAMHLALQGGGPQHYSSSDNKQKTAWDYEVRWNGLTLTQTNVKTKKERQVRQKASSWMGSLLDAFDEVFLVPDSAASRLIPLERPRKPPPPTDADSAKLHVAHAAVWDAGCSVYGGFVRDWVIRGESANDIDVNTGDYDATQRAMQQALQPYGITMQTSQPWGETKAYRRLTFVWQGSSLEVDLVDPSKVPHTPPGVDCDVGNLKIDSRGGLQLKVPELVSLEKSIKHALSKKFVCFYEPSSDMAKRRIHKYMQRGWASKNEKPKYAARYWEPCVTLH
jgi:hypothetical protein